MAVPPERDPRIIDKPFGDELDAGLSVAFRQFAPQKGSGVRQVSTEGQCPACSAALPAESKFCPRCGFALPITSGSSNAPNQVHADESSKPRQRDSSQSDSLPSDSSSSVYHGQFLPGTRVAGRYRIVSLLGQGGMGEVYRADDLKLGHAVALKFLPKKVAQDSRSLEFLHNEVRLARQIAHPNVCRVYDIGEVDGQHFLSMEFVDGEDLKGLLRRIGRLPHDKGFQIAQQLCAGLAAAHARGVLHRDLKPANITIDGRGHVRITDFGLARLSSEKGSRELVGTPAYMAPEQLGRGEATVQSDLYAVGLILYEAFTGKRVRTQGSVEDLREHLEDSSNLTAPSQIVQDIDPAVERAIVQCLESDPDRRPLSVAAVLSMLPGRDPLATALAVGDTPSPEMVAAGGGAGTIPPAIGAAALAGLLCVLWAFTWLSDRTFLCNRVPEGKQPVALADDAVEIMRALGYSDTPGDVEYGFENDYRYLYWLRRKDDSPKRWDQLATGSPAAIFFWYRQSPHPMVATSFLERNNMWQGVTLDDPPMTPGMVTVRLAPDGKLLDLEAVPTGQRREKTTLPASPEDVDQCWAKLFEWARLDLQQFETQPAPHQPLSVFADQVATWKSTAENVFGSDVPAAWSKREIWIDAGAYQGRPVYFRIWSPWSERTPSGTSTGKSSIVGAIIESLFSSQGLLYALLVAGIFLAAHNLSLGRGDRKGATRLALVFFSFWFGHWFLTNSHVPTQDEYRQLMMGLAWSLFGSATMWMVYIALEPYVRRYWPEILISWNRLLSGRFRDPLVGRDVLVGILGGACFVTLECLEYVAPWWFGWTESNVPAGGGTHLLSSGSEYAAYLLFIIPWGFKIALLTIVLPLLLLRRILRLPALAAFAYVAYHVFVFSNGTILGYLLYGLSFSLMVFIVTRFGLLAMATFWFARNLLAGVPLTPHLSSWYFNDGLLMLAVMFLVATYGFLVATRYRPLFPAPLSAESP